MDHRLLLLCDGRWCQDLGMSVAIVVALCLTQVLVEEIPDDYANYAVRYRSLHCLLRQYVWPDCSEV